MHKNLICSSTADAKDHFEFFDALAVELGSSLIDIDMSGKSPETPAAAAAAGVEDYDDIAEDAVDCEDIQEQYEGPETETATEEEDHLMPKRDYLSVDVSATTLVSPVFDDENYYYDDDKNTEAVVHESQAGTLTLTGFTSNTGDGDKTEVVHNNSVSHEIAVPGYYRTHGIDNVFLVSLRINIS